MQIHSKMICSSILLKGASHDLTRVTACAHHSIHIQISQNHRNNCGRRPQLNFAPIRLRCRLRLRRATWAGRCRCLSCSANPRHCEPVCCCTRQVLIFLGCFASLFLNIEFPEAKDQATMLSIPLLWGSGCCVLPTLSTCIQLLQVWQLHFSSCCVSWTFSWYSRPSADG